MNFSMSFCHAHVMDKKEESIQDRMQEPMKKQLEKLRSLKNKTKKMVKNLGRNPNGIFKFVKYMKKDGKDDEAG